jgi:MFS family permease
VQPTSASAGASRNYPLLLASQFLSAFGDNLLLMIMLGPFLTQFKSGLITAQAQSLANVYYTSLLFLPYVLLAPLAGYLNDRFSKNRWLIGGNAIKLTGAALTALSTVSGRNGWRSDILSSASALASIHRPNTASSRKFSRSIASSKPTAPSNSSPLSPS